MGFIRLYKQTTLVKAQVKYLGFAGFQYQVVGFVWHLKLE
jgi:hypothetical protein